ncbi:MAG: hypothetical protein ACE5D6_00650 [Candidatus Zixiibacteriota bacterium]
MFDKSKKNYKVLIVIVLILFFTGCADTTFSDPKSVVIAMFGAMEKNDKAALAHLLDLPELMKSENKDYALQMDNPRVFTSPQQILEDLTGDGVTKTRWFSMQRIVNKTDILGETATVEVTFVDKQKSIQYYTRFGVHLVNGKWKIYSFKTIQQAP